MNTHILMNNEHNDSDEGKITLFDNKDNEFEEHLMRHEASRASQLIFSVIPAAHEV